MATGGVRRVTVSAWAGSTNLGDELVLSGLVAKLRARGVAPHVLSGDVAGTAAAHGVAASSLRGLLVPGRGRPDAVVLGGGGLLQDETSPFNLPFHLGRTALAAGSGGVMAGVGLGAGPVTGALGRRLVARSLSRAVAVSVRDRHSAAVLADLGVDATVAADLALSLPVPRVHVEERLAVSLRPWSGGRGVLPVALGRRRSRPATPPWFVPTMAAALDDVAAATGLSVHFVALQADRDDRLHHAVAARMRARATFAIPDVGTVVAELAGSQAVVAMRYHAAIAAVLGGRPAVVIGYSPKVPALVEDVPAGLAGLAWGPAELATLPAALATVVGRDDAVAAGRAALRRREAGNDEVLDRLFEAGAARTRSRPGR